MLKRLIWTNFALGLWLMVSPLALGIVYRRVFRVLWEDFILGFLIAIFSLGRLLSHQNDAILITDWLVTALGILTLINPLLYHYYNITLATRNNLVIGSAVFFFAGYVDWKDFHWPT